MRTVLCCTTITLVILTAAACRAADGGSPAAPDSPQTKPRVPAGFQAKTGTAPEPYTNTGWAKEIVHKATGMELVFVPAGRFLMGSPNNERARTDDETQHEVVLTKPFYMGKCEVTQAQWLKIMGKNPSQFKGDEQRAVECVSWNDCQEFLSKVGVGTKLPTEAQWEYAGRAGSTGRFCFGDDDGTLPQYAWYNGGGTHPVGQKKPNAWGLYDMHGNVYEWCIDWFGNYPSEKVNDPTGPEKGERHVLRGGCYRYSPRKCRSAYRGGGPADGRYNNLGVRVVVNLTD